MAPPKAGRGTECARPRRSPSRGACAASRQGSMSLKVNEPRETVPVSILNSAKYWSEWQDLNLRPPRPERGAFLCGQSVRHRAPALSVTLRLRRPRVRAR
jgi:hypothetical protein